MAILVTGGAGYIGTHTLVELLEGGLDAVAADNLCNSKMQAIEGVEKITGKKVTFIKADVVDKEALNSIFERHGIDAVIHFAALKSPTVSVAEPLTYYHNNLCGLLNLCEVMAAHGCKKLVFSSSATVYGMTNVPPFKEDMPLSAINPYGWTKVMSEQILRDLCASDPEWSIVILRYFNPIGAHQSGLIGDDPNGIPNNLVPYVARVAAGILPELPVCGTDYATSDGTGLRDYIHVCDLAKGHIKALEKVQKEKGCFVYNLGTGKGVSVWEIVKAYEEACGHSIKTVVQPRRPGDVAVSFADCSKAERELGWHAAYGYRDMCRDSWNYAKKHL